MAEKTIQTPNVPATQNEGAVAKTREEERYIVPAVDIYETDEGLTLVADVPGVKKDGLHVNVEDGILTIRGQSGYEPRHPVRYSEFALVDYFRQFELSEMVDPEKISARLEHGVLTLSLPKAEKAKPKKIEVVAG